MGHPLWISSLTCAEVTRVSARLPRCGIFAASRVARGPFGLSLIVAFNPADDQLDVWQLPRLSASLLRLCDGRRTVREIANAFTLDGCDLDGLPIGTACVFGLTQLREDGFIGLSARPVIWDDAAVAAPPRYSMPPQAGNTQQPWPPRKGMSVEQADGTDLQSGIR